MRCERFSVQGLVLEVKGELLETISSIGDANDSGRGSFYQSDKLV